MIAVASALFAITVAHNAALRPSCDASDQTVATVPAGTEVEIRFAVSDGSNCYKIAATVDGKPVLGYVDGGALAGVQAFDEQRRGGASLDGMAQSRAVASGLAERVEVVKGAGYSSIVDLLKAHQPARALEDVEHLLKTKPRDPNLLMMASVAAYQSDDIRRAESYCRDALALSEDGKFAAFCRTVDREAANDKSGDKLVGMRVALRYEGQALPAEAARNMLAVLDEEFGRISVQLGCAAEERVTAVVQSREAYRATTNAAEWSGGLYDGRIHVALMEGANFGPQTRRALAHEIVHACLANIGRFPAWLHEGLAQKLSGDALGPATHAELMQRIAAGGIPKLENLQQDWSRLSAQNARLAYSLALLAVDTLMDQYANYGLRNILHNSAMLAQVTAGVDKALGL